jgi:hypothetical protein
MASLRQLEANRRNARRSTGPRTDCGKAIARLNALKHGLRTETIQVLPGEDPEAFRSLLIDLVDEYRPQTPTQVQLVRRAAGLMWKERRADSQETLLEGRFVRLIEQEGSEVEKSASDLFKMLTNQRRYSGSLHRDLDRTLDAIRKNRLEHERQAELEDEWVDEAVAPNEPNFDVTPGSEIDSIEREVSLESEESVPSPQAELEISASEPISESAEPEATPQIEAEESATPVAPNEPNSEAVKAENRRARRAREAKKRKRLMQKAARKLQAKR